MPDTLALSDWIASRADAMPLGLVCSWTDGGMDAVWVQITGELEISTVPQLARTLREPRLQARLVVLDLRDLEFIDCSGVRAIVDESRRARQAGRRLVLLRGPAPVDRMFTLTGCSDDVEIGDVDPFERPIEGLPRLAEGDLAS
jgi:anti-sigma B factor antagonist